MNNDSAIMRLLWPLLGALAGSITALSFRPYKNMQPTEIFLSIFVGASFATFVGPSVVWRILGSNPDPHIAGSVYYVMASGSNILIPIAIRWLARVLGVASDGETK